MPVTKISTIDLVNRLFSFCELYSGMQFFPYQEQFSKRVIQSLIENDGAEISALFSRQSGKTETIATTIGGLLIILPKLANMPMFMDDHRLKMFRDGLWVGIFAPTQRQAQITYYRLKSRISCKSALSILKDPEFNLGFNTSNGQNVSLTNGSFVSSISASDNASIEGESFKLILLEECQDISDFKITKSLHPMGAAYNATIVKIGTASTVKGNFYFTCMRNKSVDQAAKEERNKTNHGYEFRLRNHFEYDYRVAAKYNEKYRTFVEKEKIRLGEESDSFRMSYNLEWIIERGMFIDVIKFERDNTDAALERCSYDLDRTHVVGLDLGKQGDSTIVTVVEVDWSMPVVMESRQDEFGQDIVYMAYNTYVKDWLDLTGLADYDAQYDRIMDYLKRFKIERMCIDTTKESSMADRLAANLSFEVIPYAFSSRKAKSDLYKNLDSEIFSRRLQVCGGANTVKTVEYRRFLEQMGSLEKRYEGAYLVVNHPELKDAHDDYCLSLDTLILTKRGFLSYDSILENDLVASVFIDEEKIIYKKSINILRRMYTGVMYRFVSKDLDIKVTKNHKMIYYNRNGIKQIVLSQDLAKRKEYYLNGNCFIPVAPIQDEVGFPISDDAIKLIAWLITEGWISKDKKYKSYRYGFAQSKYKTMFEDARKTAFSFINDPYEYERKDGVVYWMYHKKDNEFFNSIFTGDSVICPNDTQRIPRLFLDNFSYRQLLLLKDTMMLGDGSISKHTYNTSRIDLARDFQELCHKLGIKTSIRQNQNRNFSCYLQRTDYTHVHHVEKSFYSGMVWCVNVDDGFIVIKRNDKISVVGNCDSLSLAMWAARSPVEKDETESKKSNIFGRVGGVFKKGESLDSQINRLRAKRR